MLIWKWWHGWSPEEYDELAGAMVAGHVIECGTQATGGNFSGFLDLPRDARPLGFPIAEVAADGSAVITKHDGTGGLVSVDTVTAQLLYEVQSQHYLGPDATVDLSTIRLEQEGADRVRVSGVRGSAPPEQLKVCVNELGGWRNQVELVLTGLDVEEKAAWVRAQLEDRIRAASVTWSMDRLAGSGRGDRGGRELSASLRGQGRRRRCGRQGLHRRGDRARPGVVPRVLGDGAARQGLAVRRLPGRLRRPWVRDAHRAPARRVDRGGRGRALRDHCWTRLLRDPRTGP